MHSARSDKPLPPTPICAIGASAGGIKALQDFFAAVPDTLGAAFVVIIHLAPDRPSALSDILGTRTSMPVHQVEHADQLQPDQVYVISPDRELVIRGNEVAARPFTEPRGHRSPIDMFFRSVAAGRGDGIAIVLSGTGSDGSLGVRAVKEAGGVVFVQDPDEAEYPMMPRSAMATGVVDFVAPVDRLARWVAEVMHSKEAIRRLDEAESEQFIRQIVTFLHGRSGHDFSNYKRATIMRRIARRMQVTRQTTLRGYYLHLRNTPEEVQELFSDLLISVTQFFRDPQAFRSLANNVIKPAVERVDGERPVRVWVVGCATGEEAYSIAILLLEEAAARGLRPAIQIFATDLDESALAVAREGRYPKAIEADLSDERLQRFFVAEGEHYCVRKELRDLVLFATHSALKDPPFIRLDLIACRNLLIYLKRELQRQLCTLFHYALRTDGFLFLGSAETADAASALFTAVDRDARIYSTRGLSENVAPMLPQLTVDHRLFDQLPKTTTPEPQSGVATAHVKALEQMAPPSVLVDNAGRILHLSPNAGHYFRPSEGPFNTELATMVWPELRVDLKLALRRALELGESTLTLPMPVAFDGARRSVAIHVLPINRSGAGAAEQALVLFLDAGRATDIARDVVEGDDLTHDEVRRLRQELAVAQDRLATSRTEHEQATQDLRAANEELQSINEEYRSTAEELETSKEELQSMNKELQTLNAELKSKLETISSAHNDLQNLMGATEIGTLFLDTELRIKLFTPAVANHFNITAVDIGRPITDFTNRLSYDSIARDARQVLRTLVPAEQEVSTRDSSWLAMRLRPYRTLEDRIEGVVVTFSDITQRKNAENALAAELNAIIKLQQLSTRMIAASELDASLTAVLETAMELSAADSSFIQLLDEKTGQLRVAAQRGIEANRMAELIAAWQTNASSAALPPPGRQVSVADLAAAPDWAAQAEAAAALGVRALQLLPLSASNGRAVGLLSLQYQAPHDFTPHQLRLTDVCARQGADTINAFLLQQSLRDSEARMRKVLQTDAVGVIFFNDDGQITDANDAFFLLTGYTRGDLANGLDWRRLTPAEFMEASEQQWKQLEETGRIGPYEKQYFCADGSRRWMVFAGRRVEPGLIAEYCLDISDRKRAEDERELLSRELSHRVKNTLAVVLALARQTHGDTVPDYRTAFVGRLTALAQAHSLLLETGSGTANLRDLAQEALAPYRTSTIQRVTIDGPSLTLTARQAMGLSLLMHELATNALKYGSLSQPGGTVTVFWHLDDPNRADRSVRLLWRERGGPPVSPPTREGFGARMLRRAVQYELDGASTLTFAPDGLQYEVIFPLA